ncbi:GntR family histidine utilization transcriptional repressor [Sphingomonas sp. SORGH_AS 950]|uniref:UTRA domain-containing protein n=1 Tax=Sphingomonas sp. SORGH_AS_0950 TaxID=3041792 RepID=UPI00278AB019|nr:UTRA domain-containing protein [Sphingomonas sp. SORGH_AS_0950]MDQ1158887.1 GntR family histidine utilization transcriptional repressor [Sphingomonas sp. SORGH_AS_0950]
MTSNAAAVTRRDQIAEHVIANITSGRWATGDRIPSEHALSEQFGVSRMTVHHALRDLTTRGFLVRRSGSGTFVAEPSAYVAVYDHLDILSEVVSRGGSYRAQVLRREIRPMTVDECVQFGTADGNDVFHAVILHFEDDRPVELEDRLIAPRFLPDAMAIDLSHRTLFSYLMLVRPYREGSETVRAILGSSEECALLAVDGTIPCLEVTRRTWSTEGVVTIARMLRSGEQARMVGRIGPVGRN